ncbi:hypothetical protein M2459_000337 [Parabacteroides sp. PF5-5]|uniref:vWA domain-containing protein n=1 Tax=unclassified Parabacteroides TaxID=2649774 RepID=UPI002474EBD8|nr:MULTISPECIES: vWA domain-containing protein [unclassified Parabacteroides]MDH6306350.1 hypothetical protein [Parabacteroides sp. PH5-39]MDH6314622.1 hypothetical protein [Parabacteroides sp. PF5-13]MDH6321061.1 hypothetical protein [Parabacteroides sp. PH5-13]MDH6324793.1 hypothetical protein [Parabacteroides sp. PH5-8]MDH6325526.1 hypothetical protein [Parabacteroides sp. PH5-41]
MKRIILFCVVLFVAVAVKADTARTEREAAAQEKIQVAILLDTSGSMQGLIEQAKSRLWNIVNTLTTLKYKGKEPKIEIALYEYGSSKRYDGDYIRQITPLTTDLDLISQELFVLTAGGSEEYCGTVIQKATRHLEWGDNEADMKLIYIAGNEIFEQGKIPYKEAIKQAVGKNIYINTIHCGHRDTGIRDFWQDAAVRGGGKFFNIDSNAKVRYIATPYDDEISHCNTKLNDTYISYGSAGESKKANQRVQDSNAQSISSANYAERVVSKSKSVYKNTSWDLVDKYSEDKTVIESIDKKQLPKEYQNKSNTELKEAVIAKEKERATIQKQITELAAKRQAYIDNESKKDNSGDDLGKAINESILSFAKIKGYSF